MKGIVNIAGEDNRFVFQGVHMLFDGTRDRAWKPNEIRKIGLSILQLKN